MTLHKRIAKAVREYFEDRKANAFCKEVTRILEDHRETSSVINKGDIAEEIALSFEEMFYLGRVSFSALEIHWADGELCAFFDLNFNGRLIRKSCGA